MSNSLVYRYDVNKTSDGLEGDEGTFWLVEAMIRAGQVDRKRLNEARLTFTKDAQLRQSPGALFRADRDKR